MSQKAGVISTIAEVGPESAFVYYDADEDFSIYFVTVLDSRKHRNIQINNEVSFVVSSINPPQTVQIQGKAIEVLDKEVLKNALVNYIDIATYQMKDSAPLTKMNIDGGMIVYKIEPTWVRWSDYSDSNEGRSSTVLIGDND
jgi:general stress protein 26